VIDELDKLQADNGRYEFARNMFVEYFYYGPEAISFAFDFYELAFNYEELESNGKLAETITGLLNNAKSFFKDYNKNLDRAIFHDLTPLYAGYVSTDLLPIGIAENWEKTETAIYEESVILNYEELTAMLNKFTSNQLKNYKKIQPFYLRVISI
jgi:hypothetical protein